MKEALKVFGISASIISSVGSLVTFNDYSRALFMEKVFGIKETEKLNEVEVEKLKHQAEKAELATKVAQLEAEQLKIKQEKEEIENKLLKEKQEKEQAEANIKQENLNIEKKEEQIAIVEMPKPVEPVTKRDTTKGDVETFLSGAKYFSYTKIANDGSELQKTAQLGNGEKDWACTKDNKTGLIWEIKTDDDGLRDKDLTYTWWNPNREGKYSQFKGTQSGAGRDTYFYTKLVNEQGLCGEKDWRLPTMKELSKLVYCPNNNYDTTDWLCIGYSGSQPTVNVFYFPNTLKSAYWSSDDADNAAISTVSFSYGGYSSEYTHNTNFNYIRLVRTAKRVLPQSAQIAKKNENAEQSSQEIGQTKTESEKLKPKVENDNVKKLEELTLKKEVTTNKITPQSMVNELISIATKNGGLNNEFEIQDLINKINALPKPTKGNVKEARKINDKGLLALSNNEDYDNAVRFFSEALKLDPADVEIMNNLGFAYTKQQNFDMAEKTLIEALTLSPARSSAWSNLGDVFALKDNESKAIACYANTYRFSQNRINTQQFMKRVNFEEEVPFVEDVRGKAMVWAKNAYQLN